MIEYDTIKIICHLVLGSTWWARSKTCLAYAFFVNIFTNILRNKFHWEIKSVKMSIVLRNLAICQTNATFGPWAKLIAIMPPGLRQKRCDELMHVHTKKFLHSDSQRVWLQGAWHRPCFGVEFGRRQPAQVQIHPLWRPPRRHIYK